MPSHAFARVDANHKAIVAAFRGMDCFVEDVSGVRNLGWDIIVIKNGRVRFVEIKNGRQPPSRRALTDSEREAMEQYPEIWRLVESLEDAQALYEEMIR